MSSGVRLRSGVTKSPTRAVMTADSTAGVTDDFAVDSGRAECRRAEITVERTVNHVLTSARALDLDTAAERRHQQG